MRHIVVCDDEKSTQAQVQAYLERYASQHNEEFRLTFLSSGEELLSNLHADVSLLLLDIQMGTISGMEAAYALRMRYPELCIIFITSQVQYALEGYAVHAFGFLRKPLHYGQFCQQLGDALIYLNRRSGKMVTLKGPDGIHQLNCNSIYYIESYGHNVAVTMQTGQQEYSASITELEQQLQEPGFFRCHKSYLVNLRYIWQINAADILMLNGDRLPLSRHRRKAFLLAFAQQAEAFP